MSDMDKLREAIVWLVTELPVGWESIAEREERGDVVETVHATLAWHRGDE